MNIILIVICLLIAICVYIIARWMVNNESDDYNTYKALKTENDLFRSTKPAKELNKLLKKYDKK